MTDQGRTVAPEAPPGPPPARRGPEPAPSRRERRIERRRAVRARRRRRLRRGLWVVVIGALVAATASVGPGWVGDRLRDLGGSSEPAAAPVAEPSSVLIAWPAVEDSGGAVAVLLGIDPERDVASGLLLPASTQVEVPSFGSQTLAETLRTSGGSSLALAVENAVGVRVDHVVELDADGLRELLRPVGRFSVRLREPVVVARQRFRSGTQDVSTANAVRLLVDREPDADDFEHLVAVHGVLEGWLRALGESDQAAREQTEEVLRIAAGLSNGELEGALGTLIALGRTDVSFATLPVQSLGLPQERYAVDAEKVDSDAEALFPGLVFPGGAGRTRVEVLNGTGRPGVAAAVTARVVPAGFRVLLTGNAAEFGLAETLIVLQDPAHEADAERLREALGVGSIRMARNPVSLVDVSVVVGADFDPGGG